MEMKFTCRMSQLKITNYFSEKYDVIYTYSRNISVLTPNNTLMNLRNVTSPSFNKTELKIIHCCIKIWKLSYDYVFQTHSFGQF